MLWIAVNLPQLPLDTIARARFCAGGSGQLQPDLTPLVITESAQVGWCNPAAVALGIRPGMSENNAWALCANLQAQPRDTRAEQQALHEAALWALHFTPQVVLQARGLLAEVAASLRLFEGLENLRQRLAAGIAELGLQAQLASAPTATGAWLLAHGSGDSGGESLQQRLDALALAVVPAAAPHLDTLLSIGCNTLGQLRQLPRAGLARRFGAALLQEIDRAYGHEPEAHQWFVAPPCFDARLELQARVDSSAALLFAARRLLLQLSGWLHARQAGIRALTLSLHHETRRASAADPAARTTALSIALTTPSRDLEHLSLLLRERLKAVELSAPVLELALRADQIVALDLPNTELFANPANAAHSIEQLVERLQSRLGFAAVSQLALHADHRPEKNYRQLDVGQQGWRLPKVEQAPRKQLRRRPAARQRHANNPAASAIDPGKPNVDRNSLSQAVPPTNCASGFLNTASNSPAVVQLEARADRQAVRYLQQIRAAYQTDTQSDSRPPNRFASANSAPDSINAKTPATPPTFADTPPNPCARPLWLLPQPLPLRTERDQPYYRGRLSLLVGPERIESGWWDDGRALRDYFIAEDARHALVWIFRLRDGIDAQQSGWFLHGFFA